MQTCAGDAHAAAGSGGLRDAMGRFLAASAELGYWRRGLPVAALHACGDAAAVALRRRGAAALALQRCGATDVTPRRRCAAASWRPRRRGAAQLSPQQRTGHWPQPPLHLA